MDPRQQGIGRLIISDEKASNRHVEFGTRGSRHDVLFIRIYNRLAKLPLVSDVSVETLPLIDWVKEFHVYFPIT
jgi:hypothetical protein